MPDKSRFKRVGFSPRMRGCFLPRRIAANRARRSPRVCGDVSNASSPHLLRTQFSPRMRGCFRKSCDFLKRPHVLPAYAGMFPSLSCKTHPPISSPRVCGDVSLISTLPNPLVEFSPRMRGCFSNRSTWMRLDAVLPAYAGMFLELRGFFSLDFCSPRVCGDVSGGILGAPEDGCSPRVCAGMFPSTELMP